jgi:effector-binding domain-containing protein
MILLENGSLDSEYKVKIPKGRYLCLDYRNGSLEQYHKSFDLIRDYLRVQDLKITGKILQLYLVDKTLTDNPHERIMEIQVPC